MAPRWNWDFEEEQAARRARPPEPAPGAASREPRPAPVRGPATARVRQLRRRRLGAGLVAALVIAAIALALSGSHHRSAAASARADVAGAGRARAHAPSKPEHDQNAAVAAVLAYTPFVKEGSARLPDVALTFDDGPGPYTPGVVSVLERFHVPATFFAIGRMERYFASSTIRQLEDGYVVGDHTENHPMLAHLSAHDQREELFEQIARIELLGGQRPTLFRPPYGSFNATTIRELRALHLLMVLWSVDTNDYSRPGVETIVQRALAGAHPGAIILLHDGGGDRSQTIAALPLIIRGLQARGLHIVTVPQLLIDDPPAAGQTLPPNLSGG